MNPMMGGGANPMMQNFPLMGMDDQEDQQHDDELLVKNHYH